MASSETAVALSTPGEMLRAAREAAGISEREMADRLNWMPDYVCAVEENRFEALRGAAFIKGYIRTYGKLLGLSEEELIASYTALHPAEESVQSGERLQIKRPQLQKHGFGIPVGIATVLVLMAGLWWWQSDEPEPVAAVANGDVQAPVTPRVEPTAQQAAVATEQQPQIAEAQPSLAPSAALQEPAETVDEVASEEQNLAVEPLVATPPPDDGLAFSFGGPCWVEVRDALGELIHADLQQAGDDLRLDGTGPFAVLLGDARQVAVSYRGQPVDIVTPPGRVKAEFIVGGP